MKKIHVFMLSLVSIFAFSAVVASAASAEELSPLWLVNGSPVPAGGVTVDVEVGPSLLLLEDMQSGPLKQATSVECEGTGLGLLLPGGLDEQNSATPEKCVRETDGACETLESVKAVNLPWLTELLSTETNETEDNITAGTGGEPGWAVECETALGKKTDTCTTDQGKTLLSQEGEEINAEFLKEVEKTEEATCTEGSPKTEAGLITGLILLMALESGALVPVSAGLEVPLWLVNGSPVPAGGVTVDVEVGPSLLLLEDMQSGPLKQATSVECEGTGLGLLLPGGLDEQNSATPEKCVRETDGACETLESVKAVNLPWLTELLSTETNETEDNITAGTGGEPGWAVECETALGKKTDTCTTDQGKTLLSQEGEEINAEFLKEVEKTEEATCTEGSPKTEAGLITGLILLMALESGTLVPVSAGLEAGIG
jgi:hypothetical protein